MGAYELSNRVRVVGWVYEDEVRAMTDIATCPVSRVAAHVRAVQSDVKTIAKRAQDVLGRALLSVIVDKEPRTITRWVTGAAQPPQAEEQLLRDTIQVIEMIASAEDVSVVRAWFMGMNPQLDDESPAEALAAGRARDVMGAARAFVNAS